MSKFSPQLTERITKYFQEKYGISLSPDEAEEYLHSWANLWNCVAGGCEAPQEPQTPPVILVNLFTSQENESNS